MSRVTTSITWGSGCGSECLTALAVVIALFGPAAWFPLGWGNHRVLLRGPHVGRVDRPVGRRAPGQH